MRKTTTTKPKTVIIESFKSLNNMIDTMENRAPRNAAFKNKSALSSQREEDGRGRTFFQTKTYSEAMQIMREGYKEPLDQMKKAILKVGKRDNYERPKMKADFVGFVPHVPNTLMNLPITMINKQRTPNKSKTIHLTYNFGATSAISTGEIIEAGVNFISLVNSLEKKGYRVKIDIIFAAASSMRPETIAVYTVTLKEYGQSLNLLKLAFPLVHPSMLRRVSFKWLECTPDLKDKDFVDGYGTTLGVWLGNNIEKERAFLKENGILKDSYYTNAAEAYKAKDVNELAAKMGIIR